MCLAVELCSTTLFVGNELTKELNAGFTIFSSLIIANKVRYATFNNKVTYRTFNVKLFFSGGHR